MLSFLQGLRRASDPQPNPNPNPPRWGAPKPAPGATTSPTAARRAAPPRRAPAPRRAAPPRRLRTGELLPRPSSGEAQG